MSWYCQSGCRARHVWKVVACSLLLFMCWPAQGQTSRGGRPQEARQGGSEGLAKVTVVQGRLSVDLKEADIQMVLMQIAQQAGFTLLTGPIGHKTVSVQFADMPLEQGLRRLLRLAALDHAMRSAPDAAGRVALQELRVFIAGTPGHLVVAARDTAAGQAQQPEQTSTPPTDVREESKGEQQPPANPLADFLRRAQELQKAPPPQEESKGEQQAATNPLADLLRRAQELQGQPSLPQQGQGEETPGGGPGQKP